MARVKVTPTVTVVATQTANVHYEAGWEGTAPHDHIDRIVAADAGERINEEPAKQAAPQGSPAQPAPKPAA